MKLSSTFYIASLLLVISCNPCPKNSVLSTGLASELNKIYHCDAVIKCGSNATFAEFESIEFMDQQIFDSGDPYSVVSTGVQAVLLNYASKLANDIRPTCSTGVNKTVTNITFVEDFLTSTTGFGMRI